MAVDVIADRFTLSHPDLSAARPAIKIPAKVRDRLPAQSMPGLRPRQHFTFETMPAHDLMVLAGRPDTGKTKLARGLASQTPSALIGPCRPDAG